MARLGPCGKGAATHDSILHTQPRPGHEHAPTPRHGQLEHMLGLDKSHWQVMQADYPTLLNGMIAKLTPINIFHVEHKSSHSKAKVRAEGTHSYEGLTKIGNAQSLKSIGGLCAHAKQNSMAAPTARRCIEFPATLSI